ncbi:ThrRS/AlaRS common domain-containing protein [Byssothecium circinans]|uniref:ThrRS/AlaRS common domain-containing protein n=1 Tax=Byssothecium circinans TaxID=147558 RepID=A0A6A5U2S6_9PLEO|nr:ThrRS/AlaRS common domain-containing protein [Byssothecium circinans]
MAASAASPVPSIVGALRCQKDSYLQSFETQVISCSEYIPPKAPQTNNKSKTKKSTDPEKVSETNLSSKQWLIEFEDSVLFPEGGGQPTDQGTITPLPSDPSNPSIPITNIQRHGLRCMHFSPRPLPPGTKVLQTVDFPRRWDHMQQHTGQHLLSAIMDTLSLPTLSWSMAPAGEMNSIEIPRKPSPDELQQIQDRCNRVIRENVGITVETPMGRDEQAEKIPGDYDREKGVVRFIKIGDLDYNACCGTHLRQTSHIGLVLLHHTTTVRGTNCRLFFSAGDRAVGLATGAIDAVRSIAVSLSSGGGPKEVQGSVQRLSDNLAEARKREKKLLAEIAGVEAERVRGVLRGGGTAWSYRAGDGLDFINLVVGELRETLKEGKGVVVLVSGEAKTAGSIMVLGEKEKVERVAAKVKECVSGVKGGGKGEKWQGKVMEWKKGEIDALKAAIQGA